METGKPKEVIDIEAKFLENKRLALESFLPLTEFEEGLKGLSETDRQALQDEIVARLQVLDLYTRTGATGLFALPEQQSAGAVEEMLMQRAWFAESLAGRDLPVLHSVLEELRDRLALVIAAKQSAKSTTA